MKKTKRLLAMMLACVAICSLLACSVFAAGGHGREYGVVNSDGTRLRTAANPNNSQNIIGLLYTGDIMLFDINSNGGSIYVLGTDNQYWGYGVMQSGANSDDGISWYYVMTYWAGENQYGYVAAQYVRIISGS